MYQREFQEEQEAAAATQDNINEPNSETHSQNIAVVTTAQTTMHNTATTPLATSKISEMNASEKDPSQNVINYRQCTLGNQLSFQGGTSSPYAASISTTCADLTPAVYRCFMTNEAKAA
ncbi:unnamed protein product [Fraxinus pennsylvanica]|uniref:Uncharacterized protein n=1 Tax=Fraxinus pennsylvanica TaxID=56036 RepID=A0AAD1ZY41_9LAMI|nr:unnamed protein product [Fraxinus pennsylvanica]